MIASTRTGGKGEEGEGYEEGKGDRLKRESERTERDKVKR